jgi:DNA uptake protein ComE-like DNA-binding protein
LRQTGTNPGRSKNLFQPEERDLNRFRILVILPLIAGLYILAFPDKRIDIKDAVPDGQAQIVAERDTHGNLLFVEIEEKKAKQPGFIYINEATHTELMLCPGIGSKTAALILLERQHAPFSDWRDFSDRVKGIGATKLEALQEAGVKLSR